VYYTGTNTSVVSGTGAADSYLKFNALCAVPQNYVFTKEK
jgi:hypothetical protein